MLIIKRIFLIGILFITFTGFNHGKENSPVVIEGIVIAEDTGKPISRAHVYILDGEEETLTNNNGDFRIESWQKIPIKLTVDNYKNFQKTSIVVTDPSRKQVIYLKIKP